MRRAKALRDSGYKRSRWRITGPTNLRRGGESRNQQKDVHGDTEPGFVTGIIVARRRQGRWCLQGRDLESNISESGEDQDGASNRDRCLYAAVGRNDSSDEKQDEYQLTDPRDA